MSTQGYQSLIKSKDGEGLHWTTDINFELPIKMASTGMGAELKPETIGQVLMRTAMERGEVPACRVMRNNKELIWTWTQFKNDCSAFAKSMMKAGIDERTVVNIMGFNSPEWAIAYYGAVFRNALVTGVYATNGAAACQY